MLRRLLFIPLIALFLLAFARLSHARELEIMSYNVENLFDVNHDAGKQDWEYLPKEHPEKIAYCRSLRDEGRRKKCLAWDWTEEKLRIKLGQIKEFLSKEGRALPEILGLIEVENEVVVKRLAEALGYPAYFVSDSPDHRGIDVALLYKPSPDLEALERREHVLVGENFSAHPTRNILELRFRVGEKQRLIVFMNHWPSQGAPAPVRVSVARQLMALVSKALAESTLNHAIAMGDFNTIDKDYPHPFRSVLLESVDGVRLVDVHEAFLRSKGVPREQKTQLALGTYFYPPDMAWNVLDRFFISRNLLDKSGIDVKVKSYHVYVPAFAVRPYEYGNPNSFLFGTVVQNTPMRYNFDATRKEEAGYSDHFPISVKIQTPD